MHYFSTTVTFPTVIVHFQKVFSAVNIHEYQHSEDGIFNLTLSLFRSGRKVTELTEVSLGSETMEALDWLTDWSTGVQSSKKEEEVNQ